MVNVARLQSRRTKGTDATDKCCPQQTRKDWPQSYGFKRFLSPPTTSCQSAKAAEDFHVWSWTLMEHVWKAVHMWQESKNMTGIICSFTVCIYIYILIYGPGAWGATRSCVHAPPSPPYTPDSKRMALTYFLRGGCAIYLTVKKFNPICTRNSKCARRWRNPTCAKCAKLRHLPHF